MTLLHVPPFSPVVYNPTGIPVAGAYAHFDASEATSIVLDASNKVQRWRSMNKPSTIYLEQQTASLRPDYLVNEKNGKNAVSGTSDTIGLAMVDTDMICA